MNEITTVISLIVAGTLGGVGLWWSGRKARQAGVVSGSQTETITNLQLAADAWEERYRVEHEGRLVAEQQLSDERAGRAQELANAKQQQAIERELAAQCRADLDATRRKLTALERRRTPRSNS